MVRQLARKMTAGMGITTAIEITWARRRHLPLIESATPISVGMGSVDIRMPLQHKRILEGIWGLYSFVRFAAKPCRVFIHSDGSLSDQDLELIEKVLPGCWVISPASAERTVVDRLKGRNLAFCAEQRSRSQLSLHLLDPLILSDGSPFVFLDSDVLIFSCPKELVEAERASCLYTHEPLRDYSLTESEMRHLDSHALDGNLDGALLRVDPSKIDLQRVESHLRHPSFWRDKAPHTRLVQTIWALEFGRLGATRLPDSYGVCPSQLGAAELTSGHYGGADVGSALYYTHAIPYLAQIFFGGQTTLR